MSQIRALLLDVCVTIRAEPHVHDACTDDVSLLLDVCVTIRAEGTIFVRIMIFAFKKFV